MERLVRNLAGHRLDGDYPGLRNRSMAVNLPGGDDLIWRFAEHAFNCLERLELRHNPRHRLRLFADQPSQVQQAFLVAQRDNIQAFANIFLADQVMAVDGYDGAMGAAYQRVIHRYAHEELGHKIQFPE